MWFSCFFPFFLPTNPRTEYEVGDSKVDPKFHLKKSKKKQKRGATTGGAEGGKVQHYVRPVVFRVSTPIPPHSYSVIFNTNISGEIGEYQGTLFPRGLCISLLFCQIPNIINTTGGVIKGRGEGGGGGGRRWLLPCVGTGQTSF